MSEMVKSVRPDGGADAATCDFPQIEREDARPQLVGDVMLATPKTLDAKATVAEARAFFANPKVVNAVLTDGDRFVGVLTRSDMPTILAPEAPVRQHARRQVPTTTAARPMTEVIETLDEMGLARMVVLGEDGVTLAGLLCLDTQRNGFCRG